MLRTSHDISLSMIISKIVAIKTLMHREREREEKNIPKHPKKYEEIKTKNTLERYFISLSNVKATFKTLTQLKLQLEHLFLFKYNNLQLNKDKSRINFSQKLIGKRILESQTG